MAGTPQATAVAGRHEATHDHRGDHEGLAAPESIQYVSR